MAHKLKELNISNIYKKASKHRSVIVLAICVLILLYFSLSVFDSASGGVFWKFDDAEHLTVATNIIQGKGLTIGYIPGGDLIPLEYHVKELEIYREINNPLQEKGPIFMLLLAPWLWFASATPDNWLLWATIFNTLLTMCLLCLFYYWVKKSFGFWVATCYTLLLASLSFIFWGLASRIYADPLFCIFSVSAFYFAKSEMGKRDIIILGVLVGLGHLTHAMGIIMGTSLLLFLLAKRKIKNAILFMSTWVIMLLPWIIRNSLLFGDPTLGLALPFLSFLKSPISSFVNPPYASIAGGWQAAFGVGPSLRLISPVDVISGFFSKVDSIYGMLTVTMLTFGLALMEFVIWIIMLKRNRLHTSHLYDTSNVQNVTVRNNVHLRTMILCGVAFVAYYSFTVIGGGYIPEARFLLPLMYFVIPISFVGVENVLHRIPEKKIDINLRWVSMKAKKVVNLRWLVLVIVVLLFIGLYVPASLSSVATVNYVMQYTFETPEQKILNSWVRDNIPSGTKIASNEPTGLYLRTGLGIIPIKAELFNSNNTYLQWIREKFSIDCIVLYNYKSDAMSVYLGNNTYLFQVFAAGDNKVYQYFDGLPYLELNPIVITDGNKTNLSLVQFGLSSYNWSLSQEVAENVIGSSSIKITRSPGTQSSFAVDRTFAAAQDWTNKTIFCVWIYGNNSGGIQRYAVAAPDWSNYFWYASKDDYTGWRLIVVPLKNFEIIEGTPNWSTVKTVRILDGATGSLYYMGRSTVNSGIIANNDKK
ncbi:MAG: ArnT family glycosyltransferase [Promethearchaeota archaeon]